MTKKNNNHMEKNLDYMVDEVELTIYNFDILVSS